MQHTDTFARTAQLMPDEALVRQLLAPIAASLTDDEMCSAAHAFSLRGPPRDAALLHHRAGPQLLAAIELGRRAAQANTTGRHIRSTSDIEVLLRSVLCDAWDPRARAILALDRHHRILGLELQVAPTPADFLKATLARGGDRLAVAFLCDGPAEFDAMSRGELAALQLASSACAVQVVDVVALGTADCKSARRADLL